MWTTWSKGRCFSEGFLFRDGHQGGVVVDLSVSWADFRHTFSMIYTKMCLENDNSVCWYQVTVGLLHSCTTHLSCATAHCFAVCKCEQKSWVEWDIPSPQLNEWVCSDKVWKDIFPKWYAHNTQTVRFCNGLSARLRKTFTKCTPELPLLKRHKNGRSHSFHAEDLQSRTTKDKESEG